MYDCLEEYMMEELKELGFDFDKVSENWLEKPWVKYRFKYDYPASKRITNESNHFTYDGKIYQHETLIYAPIEKKFVDTKRIHYYETITGQRLIFYLFNRLKGGFTIDGISPIYPKLTHLDPDHPEYIDNYFSKITYMDGEKKETFEFTSCILAWLLFEFIKYLLINKRYLLEY